MKLIILYLTTIRCHNNLANRTGIVGFQDERCGIWHGIRQNVVDVELVLFEDQSFEQHLYGRALVRVSVQDRIAAKYKQELSFCKSMECECGSNRHERILRKYIQPLS